MTRNQFLNRLFLPLVLLSLGFLSCGPNLSTMGEEIDHLKPSPQLDGSVNSAPETGNSCSGQVMFSVPYEASRWGPVGSNKMQVQVYPQDVDIPIETGCECEEIAYFVVFDLPPTAIQQGGLLQPATNVPTLSYEPFLVEESPQSNPGPYWEPPVSSLNPYPFDLDQTMEIRLDVKNDFPIGPTPENRVARVVGICIVGDIPDLGNDAIWVDFEHVPGP